MPRLRFVNKLTEEAKQQLEAIYHGHTDFAFRRRAHAILLSSRGFTISQMQDIFAVDRDTVSAWLGLFEQSGVDGLKPLPRLGRPTIYTEDEVRQLKELADQQFSFWRTHPVSGFGGGGFLKLSSMKSIKASQLSKHR
jgi:transposase